MTFEQVLVFHKIVQTGSFKAASVELHKTQPAISLAIKKLEEEMQVDLFDRSQYRPELTEHGRAFYERSARVLQGMQELEGLSRGFQNQEEPEISVSVDGISFKPQLLKLFKHFSDKHPFTKLNLSFDILSEAESKVLQKEASIGITHFVSDHQSLEVLPVTKVRMIPVMSQELYLEKNVTGQLDLLDIDQIVVGERKSPKGGSFGLLEGGKKWRLSDSSFKREVILAGLGWGHLPEHTVEKEIKDKKLMVLQFEDIYPKELQINLIKLKKAQLGKVSRILWDEIS